MNPYIIYSISGVMVILSAIGGWVFRHKILNRQLIQTRRKLENLEAIQMNSQHEIMSLRQKSLENEELCSKLTSELEEYRSEPMLLKDTDNASGIDETMEPQIEKLEKEINDLKSEKTTSQNRIQTLTRQLEETKEENRELNKSIDQLKRESDELPLNESLDQNENIKKELNILRDKYDSAQERIEELNQKVEKLVSENRRILQESLNLKDSKHQLEQELTKVTALIAKKEQQIESLLVSQAPPEQKKSPRAMQSTEKFAAKKKKSQKKEDVSSTGIRLLEAFAEELKNPKPPFSISEDE
ncbi:hypothetical protein JW979_16470 [bacterium]|nr:hypothetical protein [candidate division CSSED10-310 bacterium]